MTHAHAEVDAKLLALVEQPMPETIPEVVARLRAIEDLLGPHDGLHPFTLLYRLMTEHLDAQAAGFYADPVFIARLDLHFAETFFDAIRRWLGPNPETTPRVWKVEFEARHRAGHSKLRRAVTGMNAHINRDLAVALTQTFVELGAAPDDGTPMHRDYVRINDVLAETEPLAKACLFDRWFKALESEVGEADDLAALWSIDRARDLAWTNGHVLWRLRDTPWLYDSWLANMDRLAAVLGRTIMG